MCFLGSMRDKTEKKRRQHLKILWLGILLILTSIIGEVCSADKCNVFHNEVTFLLDMERCAKNGKI